jgi:hypothetical protein
MNLLEFLCFLLLAALVILCSRSLGRVFGVPEAALVVPVTCLLVLSLRVFTKISFQRLLILSSLLLSVTLLSMGLAHVLALRDAMFAAPVAAGLVLIAIQSRLWVLRRNKTASLSRHE